MTIAREESQTPYQILTTANAEALQEWAKVEEPGPTQTLARLALQIEPLPELRRPLLQEVGTELDPSSSVVASDVACRLVESASGKPISAGELTVAGFFRAAAAMLPNLPSNGLTKTNARVLLCAGGLSTSVLLEAISKPTSDNYITNASISLAGKVQRNSFRSGRLRQVIGEVVEQVHLPSPNALALHPNRLRNLLAALFDSTRLEGLVQEVPAPQKLAVLEALFNRHREQALGRLKFHELGGIGRLWQYCRGLSAEAAATSVGVRRIYEFKRSTNVLVGCLRVTSEDDLRGISLFLEGNADEIVLGPPKDLATFRPDKASIPKLSWSLPKAPERRPPSATQRPASAAKASPDPPPKDRRRESGGEESDRSTEEEPARGLKEVLSEVTASLALTAETRTTLLGHVDERTEASVAAARLAGVRILPFIVAARDRGALSQLHFATAVYFFGTTSIAGRSLGQLTAALARGVESEGGTKSVEEYLLECCEAWLADARLKRRPRRRHRQS